MESISAVIITLNEEENIACCLRSVSFCNEIVVVDAGSSDQTVAIARDLGATVIENVRGGRSQQRQVSLQHVSSEWLFVIDADEEVSSNLRDEICGFLENPGTFDGCLIPMQHYFVSGWIRHCGWWFPDYKGRLMKTTLSKVVQAHVHEGVICEGSHFKKLTGIIYHHGYQSVEIYFEKFNAYTTQQAMDYLACEPDLSRSRLVLKMLLKPAQTFVSLYILGKGWKDGMAGFLVGAFSSLYYFVSYTKYWEERFVKKESSDMGQSVLQEPNLNQENDKVLCKSETTFSS